MIPWYIGILVSLAWVLWIWLGKKKVRPHRTAILATAIPPTLLAIATVVLALLNICPRFEGLPEGKGFGIADVCGVAGFFLLDAAVLSSVVFAIRRKWEIAKGTGFGSGIGLVVCIIATVVAMVLVG